MKKESEAYLITDTHLRLGSKIHIIDYVYAKRLFQKSFYASKFAYIIAKNIYNSFDITYSNGNSDNKSAKRSTELVLVGYAYYSELLVSRIKSLLIQFFADQPNKPTISHIIIDNENEINLNFYFRRTFPSHCQKRRHNLEHEYSAPKIYFSIITPISSTLTTPIKIENEFHRQLSDFCKHSCSERKDNKRKDDKCQICLEDLNSEKKPGEICRIADLKELFNFHSIPFQTLVVVGNGGLEEYPDDNAKTQKLSLGFWKNIVFKEPLDVNLGRYITTQNKVKNYADRINQFNLYIKSIWENIFSCKKCFPKDILHESPLFYSDKTLVTPDFIHSMPEVNCSVNNEGQSREPFFMLTTIKDDISTLKNKVSKLLIDSTRPVITMDCVKQGHFVGTYKHFYFYFDYLRFFDLNEERIKEWAISVQKTILGKADFPITPSKAIIEEKKILSQFDKILLITPNKSTSGTFAYMINKYVFNERCNIISFNPHDENINDFKLFFKDWLKSEKPHRTIVYYVDNLIAKGNTALKVHDIIKYVRKKESTDDTVGLAGIFTMISRLENFDSFNIARKFRVSYGDSSFTGIFSFARINHPVIEAQIAKMDENNCYLCNDLNKYRMIAPSCNLDNIREYINKNNISKRDIQSKHDENLRLMPDNEKDINMFLRLLVTHELYNSFCNQKIKILFLEEKSSLVDFLKKLIPALLENSYININIDKSDLSYNEIKAIVLKTLAEKPFVIHRDIKKTVFRWILKELQEELKNFITDEPKIDKADSFFIFRLKYIRMLYKKAAQLNANFIIRAETLPLLFILSAREEEIYKKIRSYELVISSDQYLKQLSNFRVFVLAAIKESLYNNEPKSINLEKNIEDAYEKFKLLQKDDQHKISIEPPKRLFESILLENSGVIRQAYGSWDKYFGNNYINKDYTEINLDSFIDEIIKDINNIIDDTKIDNLRRFIFSSHDNDDEYFFSKDNESKSFIYSLALYNVLNASNKIAGKPEEVINLFLTILCQIMGIDINNGGAFLLLKYQNINPEEISADDNPEEVSADDNSEEISDDDLVVFGKVGKITKKLTEYLENQSNSFAKKMLSGLPFMPNTTKNKHYWTGISALKKESKWILQSSEKDSFNFSESDFAESQSDLEASPKRFYFFRICHWKNESYSDVKTEAIPQAVLVFYDNLLEEDKQSAIEFDITRVRYALGLKNELSEFIEENLINDSFRAMIASERFRVNEELLKNHAVAAKEEHERIRKVYENRFEGFNHGARRYFEFWENIFSKTPLNLEHLYSVGQIIKSQVELGQLFAKYLSTLAKPEPFAFKDTPFFWGKNDYLKLENIVKGIVNYFKTRMRIFNISLNCSKCEYEFNTPASIIEAFVLELICNAIELTGDKCIIEIEISDNYLTVKSEGKEITDSVLFLDAHINGKFPENPKIGIGLFVMNKYYNDLIKQNISFKVDQNRLFIVSLPLKTN